MLEIDVFDHKPLSCTSQCCTHFTSLACHNLSISCILLELVDEVDSVTMVQEGDCQIDKVYYYLMIVAKNGASFNSYLHINISCGCDYFENLLVEFGQEVHDAMAKIVSHKVYG